MCGIIKTAIILILVNCICQSKCQSKTSLINHRLSNPDDEFDLVEPSQPPKIVNSSEMEQMVDFKARSDNVNDRRKSYQSSRSHPSGLIPINGYISNYYGSLGLTRPEKQINSPFVGSSTNDKKVASSVEYEDEKGSQFREIEESPGPVNDVDEGTPTTNTGRQPNYPVPMPIPGQFEINRPFYGYNPISPSPPSPSYPVDPNQTSFQHPYGSQPVQPDISNQIPHGPSLYDRIPYYQNPNLISRFYPQHNSYPNAMSPIYPAYPSYQIPSNYYPSPQNFYANYPYSAVPSTYYSMRTTPPFLGSPYGNHLAGASSPFPTIPSTASYSPLFAASHQPHFSYQSPNYQTFYPNQFTNQRPLYSLNQRTPFPVSQYNSLSLNKMTTGIQSYSQPTSPSNMVRKVIKLKQS